MFRDDRRRDRRRLEGEAVVHPDLDDGAAVLRLREGDAGRRTEAPAPVGLDVHVLGRQNGSDAEIRSGLAKSDPVVVRAGPFLGEGDRATPVATR